MAEWKAAKPENKAMGWLEERLPIISLINNVVGPDTPTPRNLNYFGTSGRLQASCW